MKSHFAAESLNLLILDHTFIFVVALVTLFISVILQAEKVSFSQVVVFIAFFTVDASIMNAFSILIDIIQISLSAIVLYKLKNAVDRDYILILEKTHKHAR
jgi:hypothetical protein